MKHGWKQVWSRIDRNDDIAQVALGMIISNELEGCQYHNTEHVASMYQYLYETGEPYDEALDWAILFHDSVYDQYPQKELRSAELFVEATQQYRTLDQEVIERAWWLIFATEHHKVDPNLQGSSAIIRADLHQLADTKKVVENFVKIMQESNNLYGVTPEEFARKNKQFMGDMLSTICDNCLVDDREFFEKIIGGIRLTMRLSGAIIG